MILKKLQSNIQKLFFKKKTSFNSLKLIDKGLSVSSLQNSTGLILSTSFYWVKKEQLPVKKVHEAKKLIPAIFDGSLPDGNYKYTAECAEESGWFYIYAYDEEKVAQELESLGIDLTKIKKFFFIQSFTKLLEKPVDIGNGYSLVNDNGIICKLPSKLIEDSISIDEFLNLTSNYKATNIYISKKLPFFVDPSSILKISAALFIVALIYGVEYTTYYKTYNKLALENENLYKRYNIPKTGYQRKARIKKLESIKDEIISKREMFSKLLRIPLNRKYEFIRKLSISGKRVSIEISLQNNKNAEKIKRYLEKFITLKSVKVKSKIMKIKAEI